MLFFTTSYVTHCDAVSSAARAAAGLVPLHSPIMPSLRMMSLDTVMGLAVGGQSTACRRVLTYKKKHPVFQLWPVSGPSSDEIAAAVGGGNRPVASSSSDIKRYMPVRYGKHVHTRREVCTNGLLRSHSAFTEKEHLFSSKQQPAPSATYDYSI